MNKGGLTNYLKENAPKGEFLAYINPDEATMLKKAGGSGKLVNGIPSFEPRSSREADQKSSAASDDGGYTGPNMADRAGPVTSSFTDDDDNRQTYGATTQYSNFAEYEDEKFGYDDTNPLQNLRPQQIKTLEILGEKIELGESKTVDFNIAKLFTSTNIAIPVIIERSLIPGPTILITAAIHGDEINGVEIVRQLIDRKINKIITTSRSGNLTEVV
jgi:hypothetical protein